MTGACDRKSLWRGEAPLLLASGSAARRALLEAAGIPVEARRPDVDERALSAPLEQAGVAPARVALALAQAKAAAVDRVPPGRVVLAADQVLVVDGAFLHKPADRAAAAAQLSRLSGRSHRLHVGVAILKDGAPVARFARRAAIVMRPLSQDMIAAYLDAAGEAATSSVGGYQLEGLGAHLIERTIGEHSAILGLPILPTLAALRRLGLVMA